MSVDRIMSPSQLRDSLESVTKGMSREQLNWRPPGKWCVSEILEHLYLTYTGTIKGLEKVLARGRPLATRTSLKQRIRTFVVVDLGYMPHGRKAPAVAEPKGLPAEQVHAEIGAKLEAMEAIIARCEACFGRRVKVLDHPILGPLTTTEWRKFHLVHGRHHYKQLVRLRDHLGQREVGSTSH